MKKTGVLKFDRPTFDYVSPRVDSFGVQMDLSGDLEKAEKGVKWKIGWMEKRQRRSSYASIK